MQDGTDNQTIPVESAQAPENQPVTATPLPNLAALADGGGESANDFEGIEIETPGASPAPGSDSEATTATQTAPATTTTTSTPTPSYNPFWDRLRSDYEAQVGEGSFKMPEFTPENEYETLFDFLAQNLQTPLDDLHPAIAEQIELHKQGQYDPDNYFKQKAPSGDDILALGDRDLLRTIYLSKHGKSEQNPDGMDESDIDDFLNKKSKLELREMALNTRHQLKTNREQRQVAEQQKQQQLYQQQFEATQKLKSEKATQVVNRHKDVNEFFGVEFTAQERQQMDRDFVEAVKLDPKTNTNQLGKLLENDDFLYKLYAMAWKGDGIKSYISDLKESVKAETENKLDPKLEVTRGSTKVAKGVDLSKLV